jgi:hypothetical protein
MNQEAELESLVPTKSVLGREWNALKSERDKQRHAFESAPDKMDYNTLLYRRSNFACQRFISEMLPRIIEAKKSLGSRAVESLEKHQERNEIKLDRKDTADIWSHFVLERIRKYISRQDRRRMKSYHPGVYSAVIVNLRSFRKELRRWTYGGSQPFDGSQAMSAMFKAILSLHLLEAAND